MDAPLDDYQVTACSPKELSDGDLETCMAIVEDGGAVNRNAMRRDLRCSSLLAIVRAGGQIVGVGAIKPVRIQYAAKVARESGVEFPRDTLELGYVAVRQNHQHSGLSRRIATTLVSGYTSHLFATTDEEWMKRTLSRTGFSKKGQEWTGQRGMLSFWERT